jgi:hypothetical protein
LRKRLATVFELLRSQPQLNKGRALAITLLNCCKSLIVARTVIALRAFLFLGMPKAAILPGFNPSWRDLDTRPTQYLRAELRIRGLLDKAVIAYEVKSRGSDYSQTVRYIVVWPEGFVGEFDPG